MVDILIIQFEFSKTKCEESSLPSIKFEPTHIESDNSDTDEKVPNKLITDKKNKLKKKSKKASKIESFEKSSDEQSPTKNADESPNHKNVSESEYDPTKKNYHPIRDAFWNHNQP